MFCENINLESPVSLWESPAPSAPQLKQPHFPPRALSAPLSVSLCSAPWGQRSASLHSSSTELFARAALLLGASQVAWGDETGQGCFPQLGRCDRAAVGRDAQLSDLLSAARIFLEAPKILSISWRDLTQTP